MQRMASDHTIFPPRRVAVLRTGMALGVSAVLLGGVPAFAATAAPEEPAISQEAEEQDEAAEAAARKQLPSDGTGEDAQEGLEADVLPDGTADGSAAESEEESATDAASGPDTAADAAPSADVPDEGASDGAGKDTDVQEPQTAADAQPDSQETSSGTAEAAAAASETKPEIAAATSVAKSETDAAYETASEGTLDGFDISHWQGNIDVVAVPGDLVIIKATEGIDYRYDAMAEKADAALAAGKLIGFYHFASVGSTAEQQAGYFVDYVKSYVGKALLFLDWEDRSSSKITDEGPSWAKTWLDTVYQLTGVRPLIYMSKYKTTQYDYSSVAQDYKLWLARYASKDNAYGYNENPDLGDGYFGAWEKPTLYQYSSTTYLSGYSGNLDVDKFYGTREDWEAMAASDHQDEQMKTVYRVYNSWTGEHLFTESEDEYQMLVQAGWNGEGKAWDAPAIGTVPVYRLYNPWLTAGTHLYTTSWDEYEELYAMGWYQEGIAFYSVPEDTQGSMPILRLYNPYNGDHHFTANLEERDQLVSLGWRSEGTAFRGIGTYAIETASDSSEEQANQVTSPDETLSVQVEDQPQAVQDAILPSNASGTSLQSAGDDGEDAAAGLACAGTDASTDAAEDDMSVSASSDERDDATDGAHGALPAKRTETDAVSGRAYEG